MDLLSPHPVLRDERAPQKSTDFGLKCDKFVLKPFSRIFIIIFHSSDGPFQFSPHVHIHRLDKVAHRAQCLYLRKVVCRKSPPSLLFKEEKGFPAPPDIIGEFPSPLFRQASFTVLPCPLLPDQPGRNTNSIQKKCYYILYSFRWIVCVV